MTGCQTGEAWTPQIKSTRKFENLESSVGKNGNTEIKAAWWVPLYKRNSLELKAGIKTPLVGIDKQKLLNFPQTKQLSPSLVRLGEKSRLVPFSTLPVGQPGYSFREKKTVEKKLNPLPDLASINRRLAAERKYRSVKDPFRRLLLINDELRKAESESTSFSFGRN